VGGNLLCNARRRKRKHRRLAKMECRGSGSTKKTYRGKKAPAQMVGAPNDGLYKRDEGKSKKEKELTRGEERGERGLGK